MKFQQDKERTYQIQGDRMLITQFFSLESINNLIKTAKIEQDAQPNPEPAATSQPKMKIRIG